MGIVEELTNWYNAQGANVWYELAIAGAIIIVAYILSSIISYCIIKLVTSKEKGKKVKKNAFYLPLKAVVFLIGIYIAIVYLKLPEVIVSTSAKILKILIICLIAKGITNILKPNSVLYIKAKQKYDGNENTLKTICKIAKILVYTIVVFIVLQEFGYDLNGIIAGLGLGSVVIALAAQDIAKSLFAGASIITDKPFSLGDYISTGEYEGTIEEIKFRRTKIRALNGSLITIPNQKIDENSIVNWSKMQKRRYETDLVLMLDTKMDKVQKLMKEIKEGISNMEGVIPDSTEVFFNKITDDGININVFCSSNLTALLEFLDLKQNINIFLMNLLEKEEIGLAYKSQDIYIRK